MKAVSAAPVSESSLGNVLEAVAKEKGVVSHVVS